MTRDEVVALISRAIHEANHRPAEACVLAEQAAAGAEALGEPILVCGALRALAGGRTMNEDHAGALAALSQAIAAARAATPEARASMPYRVIHAHLEWVEAARRVPSVSKAKLWPMLDEAARLCRELGRPDQLATVALARAGLHEELGDRETAWEVAQEALAAPGLEGNKRAEVLRSVAFIGLSVKRYAEVLALLAECRALEDDESAFDTLNAQARALQGLARHAEAYDTGKDLLGRAATRGRRAEVVAHGAMVDYARAVGDHDQARRSAAFMLDVARERGVADQQLAYALMDTLDVTLDAGELEAAETFLAEAEPLAVRLDRTTGTTRVQDYFRDRRARLQALRAAP